mgnify:FL=1
MPPCQLGARLKVLAIVDPVAATALSVLERKRASLVNRAYSDTRICPSFAEYMRTMRRDETPHAFVIGSPPGSRGSMEEGRDIEVQILKAFPGKAPAVRIFNRMEQEADKC